MLPVLYARHNPISGVVSFQKKAEPFCGTTKTSLDMLTRGVRFEGSRIYELYVYTMLETGVAHYLADDSVGPCANLDRGNMIKDY